MGDIVSHAYFLTTLRNYAVEAAFIPPWARADYWEREVAPLLAGSYRKGDSETRSFLEAARSSIDSVNNAYTWLLSFNESSSMRVP